ncbi:MAG TPA: hypothetical protein VKB56_12690 [Terriglobales bacterium]|nr:hypothetical protein [Terriglobales bacterium]
MPLARIFSDSTSDAAPLVAHLQALGYTIETVPPDASGLESHADLEIRLDHCSRADALPEAERRARELGADIYIASGVLHLTETVRGVVSPEPLAENRYVENQAVASIDAEPIRDPLAPVLAVIPEIMESLPAPVAEAPSFASQTEFDELNLPSVTSGNPAQPVDEPIVPAAALTASEFPEIAELFPAQEAEAPPFVWQGGFDDLNATDIVSENSEQPVSAPIADAAAPAEGDTLGGFTLFGVRPRSEAEARRAEETPSPSSDGWMATLAKTVAILREGASQLTKTAAAGFASGGRRAMEKLRAARQIPPQHASNIASAPGTAHAAPAPPQPPVAPSPSASPLASPGAAHAVRSLPWVAFASAGAAAVAALLGWSVLTGTSAAPSVPINGSIEQQVPFGPVKIVPRRPSQPPPAVKPVTAPPHPVAAAPAAKSGTKGSVSAKSKATRHVAPSHHHSRERIADDQVIVHHYATPKPPTQAKVNNTGVKHISDQEP